jgi:hypothetical protein
MTRKKPVQVLNSCHVSTISVCKKSKNKKKIKSERSEGVISSLGHQTCYAEQSLQIIETNLSYLLMDWLEKLATD